MLSALVGLFFPNASSLFPLSDLFPGLTGAGASTGEALGCAPGERGVRRDPTRSAVLSPLERLGRQEEETASGLGETLVYS